MRNVMKKAHEITKKIIRKGDSYKATFRLALSLAHSLARKGANKMIMKKEEIINIKEKDLDKNKVIETEIGTLKYVNGESPVYTGWYIFKKDGDIIARLLRNVIQELKYGKVDYPNNLYTEEYNKKKEEKRIKQREEYYSSRRCWECGSKLDRNGNCYVCGCSKEIYQF